MTAGRGDAEPPAEVAPESVSASSPESIRLGSIVRIAARDELEAAAREGSVQLEPGQFAHGGRVARVVGVRFTADRRPRFALAGVPGVWPAACLRPRRTAAGRAP